MFHDAWEHNIKHMLQKSELSQKYSFKGTMHICATLSYTSFRLLVDYVIVNNV